MTQPHTAPAEKPTPERTLDDFLRKHERSIGIGLLIAAGLFAIIPFINLIWVIQSKQSNVPVAGWGLMLAVTCLFGGLWLRLREPTKEIGALDGVRLTVLTVGSLAGLVTVLLGLWLPFGPWSDAFIPAPPTRDAPAVPIIRLWRENAWRITACAGALFFGLALMFASLQLARGAVRGSALMRRLLFGYNAVLTGLLLFGVLFVINVLVYVPVKPLTLFDQVVDWTPGQIFTLSDATENLLRGLDKGPRFTVLMPDNTIISKDVERLMDNMRKVDRRVESRSIDPYKNPEDFWSDIHKFRIPESEVILPGYQGPDGRPAIIGGLLVEYGSDNVFVPGRLLFHDVSDPRERGPVRYAFTGEREVAKALRKLSEKTTAKIYFTQGNGELDLADSSPQQVDQGAGLLKQHLLDRGNYEVLPLKLGIGVEAVPKDAAVVVVARPTSPLPTHAVEALRAYLKREETKDKDGNVTQTRGKLLVLLDVVVSNDKMVRTGLEPLLREYDVEVANDRLIALDKLPGGRLVLGERPLDLSVVTDPNSRNPVARAFSPRSLTSGREFLFKTARSVGPREKGGVMAPRVARAESLLRTVGSVIWKTTDLTTSPTVLLRDYIQNQRKPELSTWATVAVAVTQGGQSVPIPGHPPITDKETPRMVVFGDATWITNAALVRADGKDAKDLFTSCLSWLRERPDVGVDVPEKVRPTYTLAGKLQQETGAVSRLYWLPPLFILLAVLALGGGVWVSRRR
jgi:hypothetical protein